MSKSNLNHMHLKSLVKIYLFVSVFCVSIAAQTDEVKNNKPTITSVAERARLSRKDRFKNFAELSAVYKEGVDFSIMTKKTKSDILILAIHGGKIEKETDVLAERIAGNEYNFYTFKGQLVENSFTELHITSVNFDEPRALAMAKSARKCVSIHGFKDRERQRVCMGGLDTQLKEKVASAIKDRFKEISVEDCKTFRAVQLDNIVNRCREHGVQIEASTLLRNTWANEPEKMRAFADLIRELLPSIKQ